MYYGHRLGHWPQQSGNYSSGASRASTGDKREESCWTQTPQQIEKTCQSSGPNARRILRQDQVDPILYLWPADPVHNPHMVWCHMCKKNFSIRSKGAFEILRHHRTERHLRRDQRWRYEHLKSVDPVSGKVRHRVRGRIGKVLTAIELAKELPKFIHTELVDVGERFPFYDGRGSVPTLTTKTVCAISIGRKNASR